MKSFVVVLLLALVLRSVYTEECDCGGAGYGLHLHPWVASIKVAQRKSDGSADVRSCTGVLINSHYVLTSYECVQDGIQPPAVTVTLGTSDNSVGGLLYKVQEIKPKKKGGMSLIKLTETVHKTHEIQQICLPSKSDIFQTYKALYSTSEYNHRHDDLVVTMKDEDTNNCSPSVTVKEKEICRVAGYCSEVDEPLLAFKGGKAVVAGILTSKHCGYRNPQLKFAEVSKYLKWINNNSKEGACLSERA